MFKPEDLFKKAKDELCEGAGERGKKTLEDWKPIYLKYFTDFQDNFSNEIPEEMINGQSPEHTKIYKVRGNWFFGVRVALDNAARIGMFPEDFNEEWRSFFKKYGERKLEEKDKHRTTKEEIDTANSLLLRAKEIIKNIKS